MHKTRDAAREWNTRHLLDEMFRGAEHLAEFTVTGTVCAESGYFRLGPDAICYGRCSSGAPAKQVTDSLHDALKHVITDHSVLHLPFDPVEVIDNLRLERYLSNAGGETPSLPMNKAFRAIYYGARPMMPIGVRKHFQRLYFRNRTKRSFPTWPVDCTVEKIFDQLMAYSMVNRGVSRVPFIWFWPEGFPSATVLTHDVETSMGVDFCPRLMDLNDSFGVKSAFQIVPEKRYPVRESFLQSIRSRGFEINVHDLNHDGHLFVDREQFLSRAARINEYARRWGSLGFRSAIMYRNTNWYDALRVSYDMSIPNAAHLDPQQGGCCTVLPFFIGDIVELPVTMTQDYSLFNILRDYSINLWKKQISMIREKHGLINVIVHPDYIIDEKARGIYAELLTYLCELRSRGETWIALPHEVSDWWRLRRELNLVKVGSSWRIEGKGSERARLAYAVLDKGTIAYELA